MTDTSNADSTIKKLMLKTVGQRDYSIQEVMHHLMDQGKSQSKMVMTHAQAHQCLTFMPNEKSTFT